MWLLVSLAVRRELDCVRVTRPARMGVHDYAVDALLDVVATAATDVMSGVYVGQRLEGHL